MIYIIITSSIINGNPDLKYDYNTRRNEYIQGITKLIQRCKGKPYKLVIVENSSLLIKKRFTFEVNKTFLEDFQIPVIYTRNNAYNIQNYGTKELMDIKTVIDKLAINDDDFIVKMTGRYILYDHCPFFDEVDKLENTKYSAIIRFGSYMNFEKEREKDNCITGLIGLKCKYVKELYYPHEDVFVESVWAEKIASLPENEVCCLDRLGIYIRPSHLFTYVLV